MPIGDWQFWIVTVLALAGLWLVIKPFLPRRRKRGTRVKLTIDRERRN